MYWTCENRLYKKPQRNRDIDKVIPNLSGLSACQVVLIAAIINTQDCHCIYNI